MKFMKSSCNFITISQELRHFLQIYVFLFVSRKKPQLECGSMMNLKLANRQIVKRQFEYKTMRKP